jgi:magnesium transporter
MITAYWRPKDRIVEAKLEVSKSKKTVWVDCLNPSKAELAQVAKLTGVDVVEFNEHSVDYERPTTIENEKCSLVIFAAPVLKKYTADVTSFAIFLCKNNNIITIRTEQEMGGISRFRQELLDKNPKYFDSPTKTVQSLLQKIIDTYFEHFDLFQEAADRIEAIVFEKPQKKAVEEVFKIRKSILFFHKGLVANREVILQIEKQHISRITKKDIPEFRDLYNDLVQLVDTADTQRNVLTGILDIYTSSVSNQMNNVIKKLTVVASYVLIPTLIASIYGMNFRFMPEIPWQWGYPFSLGLMVFSILAVYFYFRRSKML